MDAPRTLWQQTLRLTVSAAALVWLGAGFFLGLSETSVAQNSGTDGAISGSVTADRGVVRAFRVQWPHKLEAPSW